MNRATAIIAGVLLVAVMVACWIASYYQGKSERLESTVKQQEKTLAQQTGLITTLRADDARNRAMMAEQQRREQQLRQRGEIYQRKYQDAIKNDECARRTAPGAVLGLLRGTDTTAAGAARAVSP
ncbi:hypothetical protein L8N14_006995 [Serratia marcescens]|uniref:hypothetical protein n=1 Tax=Serratia marcescens TaxID=615 RepID=UPI001C93BB13|nr:hypothetical protein [Serratia marcescens]MBY4847808.1 hypothetical protein [Serratia marcescens]MCH9865814.1 hypothetical protein [Serratia marcescens]